MSPSGPAAHRTRSPVCHAPCSLEMSALYQNLEVSCTKLTDTCLSPGLSAKQKLKAGIVKGVLLLALASQGTRRSESPTRGVGCRVSGEDECREHDRQQDSVTRTMQHVAVAYG